MSNSDKELIWEQYRVIYEMPNFTVPLSKGTVRDEDGNKLKDMNIDQLEPNIVLFYNPHATFFTPPGFFVISLTVNEEYATKLTNGELHPIIFPQGAPLGGSSVFAGIWREKRSKPFLGIMQGEIHDDAIFIDFMTVRSTARRNQINTKLVECLKKNFPNRKIETSKRTDDGNKFWRSVKDEDKNEPNSPI